MNIFRAFKFIVAVSCGAILLAASFGLHAQSLDSLKSRVDSFDSDFRNGNGYADSANSATLAWGESHFLEAYLTMYKSYGDTAYLEKLVNHFDQMVANLSDPDEDGFNGWQTTDFSVHRLLNDGFEVAVPGYQGKRAEHWIQWQSDDTTAYRSTLAEDRYEGNAGIVIKTNPAKGWQVLEQAVSYLPNKMYEAAFLAKTNGVAGCGGRVDVYNATTGSVIAHKVFNETEWTYHTIQFRAPSTPGQNLKIALYTQAWTINGAKINYDNMTMRHIAEYLVHDGLILTPIANFILEVYTNPALAASTHARNGVVVTYQAIADEYLNLIETHFFDKWEPTWHSTNNVYLVQNDDAFDNAYLKSGNSLPHNQYLPYTRMLFALRKITGNPVYARHEALAATFKSKLEWVSATNAYRWRYADFIVDSDDDYCAGCGDNPRGPTNWEPTDYASIDVATVVDFAHSLSTFGGNDVVRMTNTLLNVMWNPSGGFFGGKVTVNSDSSLSDTTHGWALLAEADPNVWKKISDTYIGLVPDDDGHLYRLNTLAVLADWNPERAVNRGFEILSPYDATLPARWGRWQATASTVYRSTAAADRYAGAAGLVVKTNPAVGWQIAEQVIAYTPGATYEVTFFGKTNGIVSGRADIYDATAGTVLGVSLFSNTAWSQHSFTFQAPSVAGHTLKFDLYNNQWTVAGAQANFDSVNIRRLN